MADGSRRPGGARRWLAVLAVVALLALLLRVGLREGRDRASGAPVPEPEPAHEAAPDERQPPEAPVEEATRPAELVLSGRVVWEDGRTGVPGARVAVGAERTHDVATDARGRFEARCAPAPVVTVAVAPEPGLHRGAPLRAVTEEERGGSPLELRVAAEPAAPIRGRVVDAVDGRGVRAVEVALSDAAGAVLETLATDAAGAFATATPHPAGRYALALVDAAPEGRSPLLEHELEHVPDDAGPLELAVALGPCFEVVLPADEPPAWRARLVQTRGDPRRAGLLLRGPDGFALAAEVAAERRTWSWRALRAGEPPWFRYPTEEHPLAVGWDAALEVESADGRLADSVPLATVGPTSRAELVPRPVGSLAGRVGPSSPEQPLEVWLARDGATIGPRVPDADGAFAFERLEPARYRLVVRDAHRTLVARGVVVAAGRNALDPIEVPERVRLHALRGRLECELGHGAGTVLLELESVPFDAVTSRTVLARLEPATARRAAGGFEIPDVPAGRYRVVPHTLAGAHHFSPDVLELVTPARPLAFRCSETEVLQPLELDARDGTTDAALLEPPTLEVEGVRLEPFTWPESRPAEQWFRLPFGTDARWRVWATGHRPALGRGFPAPRRAGDPLELEVRLEPGFGALLVARRAPAEQGAPAAPLAGIAVRVDGVRLGETDERGELALALDAPPDQIELLHGAWTATGCRTRRDDEPVRIVVAFEPRAAAR